MNAPLPEDVRRALETVTLDDKYALQHGRAFMSGVQALVRLPMLQRQRDAAAGLNTAGFISGYRGSPLGGYDQALWAAKKHLESNRSEEHTSELQSQSNLVCRLLLEKKKKTKVAHPMSHSMT